MHWDELLNTQRFGVESRQNENDKTRTQFERDYDRLIFSSPFRRLQNKTQVFPLPGNIFVHNRLTHSLEVASVGRSLGNMLAEKLREHKLVENYHLLQELGSVVGAACLAHDLGNPPFGHSGEKAIRKFFKEGKGKNWESKLKTSEWEDLIHYEGNANALRLLTRQFKGRRQGGFNLTYTTLSTIVKYPCEAAAIDTSRPHQKKNGFFKSEQEAFLQLAETLQIPLYNENPLVAARHPLVFLVEAADDICYQIIDLEDAHRMGICNTHQAKDFLWAFFNHPDLSGEAKAIEETFLTVTDPKEQIAYLRARIIGLLIGKCFEIFWENHDLILAGDFEGDLMDKMPNPYAEAMAAVKAYSVNHIYNAQSVNEVELAGYNVIDGLLEEFIPAILEPGSSPYLQKVRQLFPEQFSTDSNEPYDQVLSVLDYVSGMTDTYALNLFRRIKGIDLPSFT